MTTDEKIAEWDEAAYNAGENWTVEPHEHIARLTAAGDALAAALRERHRCPGCSGRGVIGAYQPTDYGLTTGSTPVDVQCPDCRGTGHALREREGPREDTRLLVRRLRSRAAHDGKEFPSGGQPMCALDQQLLHEAANALAATPREPRELVGLVHGLSTCPTISGPERKPGEPSLWDAPTTPTPAPDEETRRPWNMNGPRITPVAPPADAPTETRTCGNCKHWDAYTEFPVEADDRGKTVNAGFCVPFSGWREGDDGCLKGFTPKDGPR